MDFAKFKAEHTADPVLVTQGAVLDLGEVKLKVALWGNPKYFSELQRVTSQPDVQRRIALGEMKPEEDRAMLDEVMAKTILVGWDGLEEAGKPVPYSAEKALELLQADFLRKRIIDFAQKESVYRARVIRDGADVLKKS